jgi:hypothetical protein
MAMQNQLRKAVERALRAAGKSTLSFFPKLPPILFVPDVPFQDKIYDHIKSALATHPRWYVLNYNGAGSSRTLSNRFINLASRPLIVTPAQIRLGNDSLDEYPFASTREGGRGASLAAVPWMQNSLQGLYLSAFYRIAFKFRPGTFLVVPIP